MSLSVLIIEDDEVAAEIVQKYVQIKMPEARFNWCWNGYEALVQVKEFKPDLIFLDYMMPKMDGMVFLRDLRQLEAGEKSQVAVVSAYVDDQRKKEFLAAGADFVVAKPVNVEAVHAIIDEATKNLRQRGKK